MIKRFNSFVKESVENKGKGVGGSQDLFPSAPKKQTVNGSNPTMDFLRIGKHIFTNKIDGFIDSVQNENIFITDRISGEIKKYTLSEVLRQLTQKKDNGDISSTVQGSEGTPAWAVKQKIYESDKTVLLGETYEPERQREFEPEPDEVETEQEQELEYGDEEEAQEIEYGDEEEDGGDNEPDLDDAPANSVESKLSPVEQVNKLNVSNAEKMKLLHGTEDNPDGTPNNGNNREMPNESWKKYWQNFDQRQINLVTEDLEEEDEEEEVEIPIIRGTEDNPIPASGRKTKIENYE